MALPLQNDDLSENETALGVRGDLDLVVKQQSMTGFDLKLTPMGSRSVPTITMYLAYLKVLYIAPFSLNRQDACSTKNELLVRYGVNYTARSVNFVKTWFDRSTNSFIPSASKPFWAIRAKS